MSKMLVSGALLAMTVGIAGQVPGDALDHSLRTVDALPD